MSISPFFFSRLGVSALLEPKSLLNQVFSFFCSFLLAATRDLIDSILFEVFAELGNIHNFGRFEINGSNNDSVFNRVHLLFNVTSVLQNTSFNFFETFDGKLAFLNKLANGQRKPVVVLETLAHFTVQGADLLRKKIAFASSQVAQSGVISAQKLVELVNVAHIILLLKSNVDDCVRDLFSDSVQKFGFPNNDLQLGVEVDFKGVLFAVSFG